MAVITPEAQGHTVAVKIKGEPSSLRGRVIQADERTALLDLGDPDRPFHLDARDIAWWHSDCCAEDEFGWDPATRSPMPCTYVPEGVMF